MFVAIVCPQK